MTKSKSRPLKAFNKISGTEFQDLALKENFTFTEQLGLSSQSGLFVKKQKPKQYLNMPSSSNLYSEIIDNQGYDGIWKKNCSSFIESTIESKYKSSYNAILVQVKSLKESYYYSIEDITLTILILLILDKEYSEKKDEYLLIKNKSVKTLKQEGLEYCNFKLK